MDRDSLETTIDKLVSARTIHFIRQLWGEVLWLLKGPSLQGWLSHVSQPGPDCLKAVSIDRRQSAVFL